MKKLYTNGCSMTWGSMKFSQLYSKEEWNSTELKNFWNMDDGISSIHFFPPGKKYKKAYELTERDINNFPDDYILLNEKRKKWCWPYKLGKLLDVPVVDYSLGGGSCQRIIRTTYEYFSKVKNPENYFAIIQLTGGSRIEFWEEDMNIFYPMQISRDMGIHYSYILEHRKLYMNWQWERYVYLQSAITLSSFFKSLGIQYFITGFFEGPYLKSRPKNEPQPKEWLDLCDFAENNVNWYRNWEKFGFFRIPYINESGYFQPDQYLREDVEEDQHPSEQGHTEIAKIFKNYIESNFET